MRISKFQPKLHRPVDRTAAQQTQPGTVSPTLRRRMGDALADIFDEHGIKIYGEVVKALRDVLVDNFRQGVQSVEQAVQEELGNRGVKDSKAHFSTWLSELTAAVTKNGLGEMATAIKDVTNDLAADYARKTEDHDVEEIIEDAEEIEEITEEEAAPEGETEVLEDQVAIEPAAIPTAPEPGEMGLKAQPTASANWRRRRMVREPAARPRRALVPGERHYDPYGYNERQERQTQMTKNEAKKMLRARDEDAEWSAEEVEAVFKALYGRYPTEDEDADILSLCYAAL